MTPSTATSRPSAAPSALLGLPLLGWVRWFRHGEAMVGGRLVEAVDLGDVRFEPGPIGLEVAFLGGPRPSLVRAVAVSRQERAGGVIRAPLAPDHAAALVGRLWDLHLEARGDAAGEVRLQLAPGMEVCVPGGWVLARGATCGPPDALVLSGPFEITAGNAVIRLAGGDRLRWLSSLAAIRVDRAVLHPDGRVALEGGAGRGLDRAVRSGLQRASEALSGVIRHSPRFAPFRAFLVST